MALIYRAEAHERLGDPKSALSDFDKAIDRDPQFGTAFGERGSYYHRAGKLDLAKRDLVHAIEIDGMQEFSMLELGSIYVEENRLELAQQQYARAHEALRNDEVPLIALCWVRALRDIELDLALADCNRALELAPENVAALENRGFVQFRAGRYADALADFDRVLSRTPRPASYYLRGLSAGMLGLNSQSDADIAKAIELDPGVAARFSRYGIEPQKTR
jgi:tetratricopeptide (TPR) repeat protein